MDSAVARVDSVAVREADTAAAKEEDMVVAREDMAAVVRVNMAVAREDLVAAAGVEDVEDNIEAIPDHVLPANLVLV